MYFNGTDRDLAAVKDGPGLFIGYTVFDSPTLSNTNIIISEFSKKYGNSNSLGLNVVRPEAGKSILNEVELYSFTLEKSQVSAWKYHYDLDGYSSIVNRLNFTIKDQSINVLDDYNDICFTLNNTEGKIFEDSDYVHIFAAFSCQSTSNNNFSNLYWSDLTYLGCLQIK